MNSVKEIKSDEEFAGIIAHGVVLADFWASWCGPCRMMAPVLEEAAAELAGKAQVIKVNVEECRDLAVKYMIRNIPALLVFKNGEPAEQMVGVQSKARLIEAVNNVLKS